MVNQRYHLHTYMENLCNCNSVDINYTLITKKIVILSICKKSWEESAVTSDL